MLMLTSSVLLMIPTTTMILILQGPGLAGWSCWWTCPLSGSPSCWPRYAFQQLVSKFSFRNAGSDPFEPSFLKWWPLSTFHMAMFCLSAMHWRITWQHMILCCYRWSAPANH